MMDILLAIYGVGVIGFLWGIGRSFDDLDAKNIARLTACSLIWPLVFAGFVAYGFFSLIRDGWKP